MKSKLAKLKQKYREDKIEMFIERRANVVNNILYGKVRAIDDGKGCCLIISKREISRT
jgi:hypothetical protein